MTIREYYNAVLNANISDELNEVSVNLLAKLDAKNEKRRTNPTKEKTEASARRVAVHDFLKSHEGSFTRDQIAEAIGITPTQVSGACVALVRDGLINKSELKVDKARKIGYTIA